MKYIQN